MSLLILCSVSIVAVFHSLQAQGSAQSLLSPRGLHRKGCSGLIWKFSCCLGDEHLCPLLAAPDFLSLPPSTS